MVVANYARPAVVECNLARARMWQMVISIRSLSNVMDVSVVCEIDGRDARLYATAQSTRIRMRGQPILVLETTLVTPPFRAAFGAKHKHQCNHSCQS